MFSTQQQNDFSEALGGVLFIDEVQLFIDWVIADELFVPFKRLKGVPQTIGKP